MIKKYYVKQDSIFNKSILLPLYEKGNLGFHIEGLTNNDINDLFPVKNKIKFSKDGVDVNSLPTTCLAVYLDEELNLKALVLSSSSHKYYLFKVDSQKEFQLNIHQKYISNDAKTLMDDYEKHCKTKGKNLYDGEGDFASIENIDYFENKYKQIDVDHLDKKSSIYRLIFSSNNMFTTDFISLVENKHITIRNSERIDRSVLTLATMGQNKTDRRDCLLIDSETKDIKYFIFTYKPRFIKHYFLFKNLGNDTFEYLGNGICFNEIFSLEEFKEIKYKNGSEFATKSFAKNRYDNFFLEYIAFEEEEEFEEEVKSELELAETAKKIKKDTLLQEALAFVKEHNSKLDIGVTYHGKERVLERIGEMKDEEMLALAKVAYEQGLTSVHFLEKDPIMFKFLQYQQGKTRNKTLRLYKDVLFFYSLEPPHSLVTCFLCDDNTYKRFVHKTAKIEKKKKKR